MSPDLLLMMPGVQLEQSFTRWCCGTVRYAVTDDTLLRSEEARRFLGKVTFGWDELSVNTRRNTVRTSQVCLLEPRPGTTVPPKNRP